VTTVRKGAILIMVAILAILACICGIRLPLRGGRLVFTSDRTATSRSTS